MRSYFKPFMPALKKYEKIVKFQLEQRSIYTGKMKSVLQGNRKGKDELKKRKQVMCDLKAKYDVEVKRNTELKQIIRSESVIL